MASSGRTSARGRHGERGGPVQGADPAARPSAPGRRSSALPGVGAPQIWAVGGGKGGVGKSVIASSLAAAIAGTGRRCVVIDVDLGGANLHTLLGVSRPLRTLSHLLTGEVASLAELMVPTSVPNLWLVSGNHALLDMANPKHSQKEKLFRHIRGLDVDDVVLDLGAGSAFNVLDFFLLARRGLVVVTPEPTAIENAEHFLKAALYRSLRVVAGRPDVRAAILRAPRRPPRMASALCIGADRPRPGDRPARREAAGRTRAGLHARGAREPGSDRRAPRCGSAAGGELSRSTGRPDRARGIRRYRPERSGGGRAATAGVPGLSPLRLLAAHRGARAAPAPREGETLPGSERMRGAFPRNRGIPPPRTARYRPWIWPSPAPTCVAVGRSWASPWAR